MRVAVKKLHQLSLNRYPLVLNVSGGKGMVSISCARSEDSGADGEKQGKQGVFHEPLIVPYRHRCVNFDRVSTCHHYRAPLQRRLRYSQVEHTHVIESP